MGVVYLENVVIDAVDPARLGRFWATALGARPLTDDEHGFECRLSVEGGPDLDLCFPPVPDPPSDQPRLHLDLGGGTDQQAVVDRLRALGAEPLDTGTHDTGQQHGVPRVVLADPEGNPFCVRTERAAATGSGPIAALPIASADPEADLAFWSWLTGWTRTDGTTLGHPSRRGLLLVFCPEPAPKPAAKNRLHLDVRLEAADDLEDVLVGVVERGGRRLEPGWGELPWTVAADPSGNEFCLLPSRPA